MTRVGGVGLSCRAVRTVGVMLVAVLAAGCSRPPRPTVGLYEALEQGSIAETESNLYWRESKVFGGINDPLDKTGQQPVHAAAAHGHADLVEWLIDRGADAGSPGLWGHRTTALHLAARAGHRGVAKVLADRGADVMTRDRDGRTPLELATSNGHADVADLLRRHGATE